MLILAENPLPCQGAESDSLARFDGVWESSFTSKNGETRRVLWDLRVSCQPHLRMADGAQGAMDNKSSYFLVPESITLDDGELAVRESGYEQMRLVFLDDDRIRVFLPMAVPQEWVFVRAPEPPEAVWSGAPPLFASMPKVWEGVKGGSLEIDFEKRTVRIADIPGKEEFDGVFPLWLATSFESFSRVHLFAPEASQSESPVEGLDFDMDVLHITGEITVRVFGKDGRTRRLGKFRPLE